MADNPYRSPIDPANSNDAEISQLKELSQGYRFSLVSVASQIISFTSVVVPMIVADRLRPPVGLTACLFALGLIAGAQMVIGLKLPVGKRLLLLLGMFIFPINVVITLYLRKLAGARLVKMGFQVGLYSVEKDQKIA